jgi:hypothetical protein
MKIPTPKGRRRAAWDSSGRYDYLKEIALDYAGQSHLEIWIEPA